MSKYASATVCPFSFSSRFRPAYPPASISQGRAAISVMGLLSLKFVRQLGFNRLYCYISSETELDDELRGLIGSASKEKIPVELMVRQGDFRHRFRGNALVRSFLPQFRKLPDLAAEIVEFNGTLPPQARLAGVTVRFEPHLFTRANGAVTTLIVPSAFKLTEEVTY